MTNCYNKLCLHCNKSLRGFAKKHIAAKGDLCVFTKLRCEDSWHEPERNTVFAPKAVGLIVNTGKFCGNHVYDILFNGVLYKNYHHAVVIKLEVAEEYNLLQ